MDVGIFARTFTRASLDETLAAIEACGISSVHFNLACATTESMPMFIEDRLCRLIQGKFEQCGLTMVGISASFNSVHPDVEARMGGIHKAQHMITRCNALGTRLVSLCTGTRDGRCRWRRSLQLRAAV